MKDIEFVSYDGAFPNLCSGKLVLRIDGEERTFDRTLISGGKVWFDDNWSDHVEEGEWRLEVEAVGDNQYILGPFYAPNKDVVFTSAEIERITSLVNENVEYGCCGGCV